MKRKKNQEIGVRNEPSVSQVLCKEQIHVLINCDTPVFPQRPQWGQQLPVLGTPGAPGGVRVGSAGRLEQFCHRTLSQAAPRAPRSLSHRRTDGLHGIAALPGESSQEVNAGCTGNSSSLCIAIN